MRFMIMMIPAVYRGNRKLDPNFAPPPDAVERMGKFNAEMQKAGILRDGLGLHPLSKGARISFATGRPVVTDGPFVEAKEVLGGFWMIDVKSKEEAVDWMKKCPADKDDILEIREVFDEARG